MNKGKANSNSGFSEGTEPSGNGSDSLRSTAVAERNKILKKKKKASGGSESV